MTGFDLGESAEDDEQTGGDASATEADPEPAPSPSTDAGSTTTTDQSATKTQTQTQPSHEDPAFEFSEAKQRPIYPREDTWERWEEDVQEIDLRVALRELGVKNPTKREVHDAMVAFATENYEQIAQIIASERGIDVDE